MIERNDIPYGSTYDSNGNELTYKDSDGLWAEYTYDSNGKILTFKDSDGFWAEWTYDSNGNRLTFKDSDGKDIKYD
jgi:YD repeat-containing protein